MREARISRRTRDIRLLSEPFEGAAGDLRSGFFRRRNRYIRGDFSCRGVTKATRMRSLTAIDEMRPIVQNTDLGLLCRWGCPLCCGDCAVSPRRFGQTRRRWSAVATHQTARPLSTRSSPTVRCPCHDLGPTVFLLRHKKRRRCRQHAAHPTGNKRTERDNWNVKLCRILGLWVT